MTEQEIDRCEFWVNANRLVRESGKPNYEGERIRVNFEWNLDLFHEMAARFHDQDLLQFLTYGWPLNAKTQPSIKSFLTIKKG